MIKLNLVCLVIETTRFIQNPLYTYYDLLKSAGFGPSPDFKPFAEKGLSLQA